MQALFYLKLHQCMTTKRQFHSDAHERNTIKGEWQEEYKWGTGTITRLISFRISYLRFVLSVCTAVCEFVRETPLITEFFSVHLGEIGEGNCIFDWKIDVLIPDNKIIYSLFNNCRCLMPFVGMECDLSSALMPMIWADTLCSSGWNSYNHEFDKPASKLSV